MADLENGPARSDALADRYRRHTYRVLSEGTDALPVARLAREVAARTTEKPPGAVSLDEQKRMYSALDRAHLPALEAAGLVERDHAADTVVLTTDRVDLVADRSDDHAGPAGEASERSTDARSPGR